MARRAGHFSFELFIFSVLHLLSNSAGAKLCVYLAVVAAGQGREGGAQVQGEEPVQEGAH